MTTTLTIFNDFSKEALKIPQMWLEKITSEESSHLVFALGTYFMYFTNLTFDIKVGTKSDLPENQRNISRHLVQNFVEQHGIDIYFETSAKDNYNVEELFQEITNTLVVRFNIK
jgi:ethanolamine utilization protein EutP (predicted NTPase)